MTIRLAGGLVYRAEEARFDRLDVVIEDGRIAELARPGTRTAGDEFDVAGLFLLPGLIDCHVHLAMRGEDAHPGAVGSRRDDEVLAHAALAAERSLRAGITTLRDVGGWNHLEMGLRRDIEAGRRPGPRLLLAGRLLSVPTPAVAYYPGMYEVVRGPDQVRAAARRQFELGADLIKVMATGAMLSPEDEDAGEVQLSREEIAEAVDVAGRMGGHVAAHAHAREGIENAVLAGVASIEHGTFADDAVLREMARRRTYLVPTASAGAASLSHPEVTEAVPAHVRRRLTEAEQAHVESVRAAHRLGVPIAMGTDAGTPGNPHGSNARECVLMVERFGLSPAESIDAATRNAAGLLGREGQVGTLSPGAMADLIGTRADPLDDIHALTRTALVMKDGGVVRAD